MLSGRELLELIIAMIISAIILAMPNLSPGVLLAYLIIAFFSIGFHEMFHKIYALKYGRENVRIRAHIPGLILGFVLSLFGFIFFIPAYVSYKSRIEGPEDLIEEADITISGPFANSIIAVISITLLVVIKMIFGSFENYLISTRNFLLFILPAFLMELAYFNAMLSFVNLLPFFNTDGKKFLEISYYLGNLGIKYPKRIILKLILITTSAILYLLIGRFGFLGEEINRAYAILLK